MVDHESHLPAARHLKVAVGKRREAAPKGRRQPESPPISEEQGYERAVADAPGRPIEAVYRRKRLVALVVTITVALAIPALVVALVLLR